VRIALTIAWREVASLFRLPVGWVAIALFLLLSGAIFAMDTLTPGAPASLRYFISSSAILLVAIAPAVSMRLLAEEYRTGTIERLATSPVSELEIVLGKWLGAWLFLIVLLAPTLIYPGVLVALAEPVPDFGPMVSGYVSLLLIGMLFLAVGVLASALTSSQTLAFLATLIILGVWVLATSRLAELAPEPVSRILGSMSLISRVRDFASGVVRLEHVVFFVAWSWWFIALAIVGLAARRWR